MTHPSIATVSLNAAVDQTAFVPGFAIDAVNRVAEARTDAGGKGVNVAAFLAHLGHKVSVTGLLGQDNAALFEAQFTASGLADHCLRLPGATRTNIKIVDKDADTVTDLNFPGIRAGAAELERVSASLDGLLAQGLGWVALCGSLPEGMAKDAYAGLVTQAKQRGAKVALDSSGAALEAALPARPDLIKPNSDELGAILGRRLETEDEILKAARALTAEGIGLVAVSMGARGALLVTGSEVVRAVPPRVTVASTVGAGDAMVAGLIHGDLAGLDLPGRARIATAVSLGALGQIGPRLPQRADIDAFAARVEVTRADHHDQGRITA